MSKLTVFVTNSKSGAFFEIAKGWCNALRIMGHKPLLWDGDQNTWDRNPPDIYIGCSGWRQQLPRGHKAKVAIHVNPYCDEVMQVPGGPVINESADAIKWTLAQNPIFVFGYGLQDDMVQWWYRWKRDHDIDIVGMPNAADTTLYAPGPTVPNLVCDVGWVGGYWGYKAINMDKYLLPVARKYKTIWLGWSGPKDLWKGKASQGQVQSLFNSAKICPCVVEPHTTKYGIDIPERIFKVAASGALAVSDPVHGIDRFFSSDALPLATDPDNYMDLCDTYIKMSPEERQAQAIKLRSEVIRKHTYLSRIQTMFEAFGYYNEADKCNLVISKIGI